MIIGVPKEIKNNENRIALTPAGAAELVKRGHEVWPEPECFPPLRMFTALPK
jgi:alanine dehydrogenase